MPHPAPCGVHGGTVDVGAAEEPCIAELTVDAAGVGVVVAGVAFGAPGDEIAAGGGGTSRGAGAADFMPSRCCRPFPPLPGRRRPDCFAAGGSVAACFAEGGSMADGEFVPNLRRLALNRGRPDVDEGWGGFGDGAKGGSGILGSAGAGFFDCAGGDCSARGKIGTMLSGCVRTGSGG